jgi:hypothetical protein
MFRRLFVTIRRWIRWLLAGDGDVDITFALGRDCWWSLDSALAPVILAALKQFKAANRLGMPARKDGEADEEHRWLSADEWEAMLDKMIAAFEMIVEEDAGGGWGTLAETQAREAEIADGLRLFGLYYRSLWD